MWTIFIPKPVWITSNYIRLIWFEISKTENSVFGKNHDFSYKTPFNYDTKAKDIWKNGYFHDIFFQAWRCLNCIFSPLKIFSLQIDF